MEICIAEGRRGQNIIVFNIQGLKHTESLPFRIKTWT